ncbi:MAG: HPr family phosphocarrier protein [Thermoguttaceae bacterium]
MNCHSNTSKSEKPQKLLREFRILNRAGLHLRVGSMIAKKALEFSSEIRLRKGTVSANCRSVMDLLALGAFHGDDVVLEVEGTDTHQAMNSMATLFEARFYEDEMT